MSGRVIAWPIEARPIGGPVPTHWPSATVIILPVTKATRCGCYMCAASRADPSDLVDRIAQRMRRPRWRNPDDGGAA